MTLPSEMLNSRTVKGTRLASTAVDTAPTMPAPTGPTITADASRMMLIREIWTRSPASESRRNQLVTASAVRTASATRS